MVDWQARFEPWLVRQEGEEWRGYCPMHEDPATSKTPSASFNFGKGVANCFSRCGALRFKDVWDIVRDEQQRQRDRDKVRSIDSAPSRRKQSGGKEPSKPLPTVEELAALTKRLLGNRAALDMLADNRGITRDTVKKFGLGWDGVRYTIPVRNSDGELVNVRRYKLGATRDKMLNWATGWGSATLFLSDALEGDEVVVCEGEMDALLARQYGFPALSATAGANTWFPEWSPLFAGKKVYVVYDCDDEGLRGARKVANSLNRFEAKAHVVRLPLTKKGGDVTDYFHAQSYGASDFRRLLEETPLFEPKQLPAGRNRNGLPTPIPLSQSYHSEHSNRPVEVTATVIGKSAVPYSLPRELVLNCTQDNGNACARCPMDVLHNGQHQMEIPAHSPTLMKLVEQNEERHQASILKELGAPPTCRKVEMTVQREWTGEKLFVVPSIDDSEEDRAERVVYNFGENVTPANTTVRLVGVFGADPRDTTYVMHAWECEETQTTLDNFRMTPELAQQLSAFQPTEGQRPIDKLVEIADDLAANVTRIYGRRELHIAYDLVWHSLLGFRFRGDQVTRGWLELLVMGDTRTGKSEAAERLRQHYGAGVLTSCEGATLAGLVGAAQTINNRWFVTWGVIPLQDRRLVVLDEASGLQGKNVVENMSEIRSSGKAKIVKVVSNETTARTRLIWISNPPDGRRIDEMPRGAIDAVEDLVKNPEDIARFDLAMSAASADVESSVINAARPPRVPHVYAAELCRNLVLWAWSRQPADVVWERGAARLCLVLAEKMGHVYVPDPPLVQAENARMKLARLAVAVAARLFSHDGTGEKVLVTKEHVRTARTFLARLYRQPSFGYAQHSAKELHARQVAEEGRAKCWTWLRKNADARGALLAVVNDREFRVRDLEEFGGLSRDMAQLAIGDLLRMRMIRRHTKGYIRMEPELVTLLRRLDK